MTPTFSPHNPNLQLAWDSTSLKNLQKCPRYYQLVNLEGWGSDGQIDLEYGRLAATGRDMYRKLRLEGKSRMDALLPTLRHLLEITFDPLWGGSYAPMWHCLGETKYKNDKGNAAKCPWAKVGMWFPSPGPEFCGHCGSPTEEKIIYLPDDQYKNRETLIRDLIWYVLDQPEDLSSGLHPYIFPDGTPAVELSFQLPFGMKAYTSEEYILCGHIDWIGEYQSEHFPVDDKTTSKALNQQFWNRYAVDTQFDTYDLAGSILFPDLELDGIAVAASQTLIEGANFGVHIYYKSETQREEHYEDLKYWIKEAEHFAMKDYWPMNKSSCWLCPFNRVCSLPPSERQDALEAQFTRRPRWDPLEER